MRYTVIWIREAEVELTNLWLDAADRSSITQAATEIDGQLRSDPLNFGESRQAGERIGFVVPLAVEFTVDEQERRVYVFHVRRFERRS
jgi:hypothetical protein